jgi:hypothetical protein
MLIFRLIKIAIGNNKMVQNKENVSNSNEKSTTNKLENKEDEFDKEVSNFWNEYLCNPIVILADHKEPKFGNCSIILSLWPRK